MAHPFSHSFDNTSRFKTQSGRERNGIDSAPMIGVDKVEANRMIAHPYLAGAGRGQIYIDPLDNFRSAILGYLRGKSHVPSP
jgi:hypothetical protein